MKEERLLRVFLRIIGFLIILLGIYLIFTEEIFFGTIAIIIAFLIFPNRKTDNSSDYNDDHDYSTNYSTDHDSGGSDTGGGSND